MTRFNFWKPWPRKFIFDTQIHFRNINVRFVYQGHRVKQGRRQDFTLGHKRWVPKARDRGAEGTEGWELKRGFCLPNRLGIWESVMSSPAGSGAPPWPPTHFGIFEAHKTLLVERTVLLYVPTKPVFLGLKNPLNRRLGAMAPSPPLSTPLWSRSTSQVFTADLPFVGRQSCYEERSKSVDPH